MITLTHSKLYNFFFKFPYSRRNIECDASFGFQKCSTLFETYSSFSIGVSINTLYVTPLENK